MRQGQSSTLPQWSLWLGALLLGAIFVVNVYRAATQSITHDEAVTYAWYVAGPISAITDMIDANNHLLYTILARISVKVFGHSELGLRIPSVVGGLLLFVALWLFGATACRAALSFLLSLSLVALNPLFLDFCSAARGYGLATAFLLWAMYFALRATERDSA